MDKKLHFNETLNQFEDNYGVKQAVNTYQSLKGRVRITDEDTNEVILDKLNTIVLRGRTFALEKIFNDVVPASSDYKQNLDRKVCLFTIGSGGAPESDPFNPYVPNPTDYVLGKEEPFRTVNSDDPETHISVEDASKYHGKKQIGANVYEYFYKAFEIEDPEWFLDKDTNEVYKKVILKINNKDARGKLINELGLVIAQADGEGGFKDEELFSRICFDTESLSSLNKQLLVEYMIYA